MTKDQKADAKEAAVQSIIKQWNGGERKLAGARASELVYGASNTLDEKLIEEIKAGATGIEQFVVAPSSLPVTKVPDESGDPGSPQPEARRNADGASNMSSDEAKDDQKVVDELLKPGRDQRPAESAEDIGSTKLNPDNSDRFAATDKPTSKAVAKKSAAK